MRRARPWFRKQTGTWYVQINGTKHNLGPDRTAAFDEYDSLMASRAEIGTNPLAVALIDRFLIWSKENLAATSHDWYERFCKSFGIFVGKRIRCRQLKAHHVTDWLTENGWKGSTANCAVRAVKRAFNWSVEQDYIKISPLKAVKRPKANRREVVIDAAQWDQAIAAVQNKAFGDFLVFIRETGCRPQEARKLEARHYDAENARFILTASEAKGKEDARVIYLNDAAKKLVEELMKTNPTGRLLRNSKGNPWTRNAIVCGFRRIRARTGLKGFVAYVLRHTFATDALTRGEDSVTVAALMGHRDPTMVAQVYSHVTKKPKFLSDAVKRARGESTKSVSAEE